MSQPHAWSTNYSPNSGLSASRMIIVLGAPLIFGGIDSAGHSRISVQDFAVAMIDELERPLHIRPRFTVGY